MPFSASVAKDALLCNVCAKTMTDKSMFGTNADGSAQPAYCNGCFLEGKFVGAAAGKMLDEFKPMLKEYLMGQEKMSDADAAKIVDEILPGLARWKAAAMSA